ncbi:MAG: hypothetical protein R3330_14990, partial [Saprospiraceae bacterium]|nr:hypothetical protein [Saprospiraceae bacterium]
SPKFIEGGRINISIPRIDYGFKGSFEHALMTVSKEGGGVYAATTSSPVSVNLGGLGGPSLRRVPNGKVTIEEYTPFILRGTFEASLVERRNDRPVDPHETVPVVNHISGRFSIVNPFESDTDYRADETSLREQVGLDLLDNPGMSGDGPVKPMEALSADDIRELCEMGIDDHMLEGIGVTGGCQGSQGGQGPPTCRCDCEEFNSPEAEACQVECAAEYLQCADQ